MNRRRFLATASAACALGIAGCVAGDDTTGGNDGTDQPTEDAATTDTDSPTPAGGDTDTRSDTSDDDTPDDDTSSPTDAPTETPTDSPAATPTDTGTSTSQVEGSLSVTSSDCGQQVDDAFVAFDGGKSTVTVTGTIWGNDACYTARLGGVTSEDGALTVRVAAEDDSGTDQMCAQCITEIAYEATVTVPGDLPGTVTVEHRHGDETTTVAEQRR